MAPFRLYAVNDLPDTPDLPDSADHDAPACLADSDAFVLPAHATLPAWRAPDRRCVAAVSEALTPLVLDGLLLCEALRSTWSDHARPDWQYGRYRGDVQQALARHGCEAVYYGNFRAALVFDHWVLKVPIVPAFVRQNAAEWAIYRRLPRVVREVIFPRTRYLPSGALLQERCVPAADLRERMPEPYLGWVCRQFGIFGDLSDQNIGRRGAQWVWLDWAPPEAMDGDWPLYKGLRDVHDLLGRAPFPLPREALGDVCLSRALIAAASVSLRRR